MENGPTKEQAASLPPLPAQLSHSEEGSLPWHAVGSISATNTSARAGHKAWCLGMEEVLPKNISNYLRGSGSQRAGVIYIVRAGR